jgi:NADPH:quinone reductase-like Zn-dependent oxidoreductase
MNKTEGTEMKAVVLTAYGDSSKLELRDVPAPVVGASEIVVRMVGAGINPIDWKLRNGALQKMMPLELPAILGRDVAGEVLEVGSEVTDFAVGDRVMGLVNKGYAQLVVGRADAWAKVPETLDLVEAAALPLALLTGAQLVEDAVAPREGDVVLVTGATGSVGRVAVFVAKQRGAKVWAGVRRSQKAEATKLGAEGIVALDDDSDIAELPVLDAIADTVGGETIAKILGRLKPGGKIGSIVGEPPGAKERGFVVQGMFAHPDAKRLTELARAVAALDLVIPIAKKLPLSMAREGQDLAEGHAGGKIVLMG